MAIGADYCLIYAIVALIRITTIAMYMAAVDCFLGLVFANMIKVRLEYVCLDLFEFVMVLTL